MLIITAWLVAGPGCGNETGNAPSNKSKDASSQNSNGQSDSSQVVLLLNTLDNREEWPSSGVKIWLKNPTVSVSLSRNDGPNTLIHAWSSDENDYGVAMIRVNEGDMLYAITDDEFLALASLELEKH